MRWTIAAALLAFAGCAGSQAEQRADTLEEEGLLGKTAGGGAWQLLPENTAAFPMVVGPGTTVVKDGHEVGLDALRPGEPVRVTYALEPSGAEALRIEVVPAGVQPLEPSQQPGLDVLEPGTGPQPTP